MGKQISDNALYVLILISIVLSSISAFTMLTDLNKVPIKQPDQKASGQVNVFVRPPPADTDGKVLVAVNS